MTFLKKVCRMYQDSIRQLRSFLGALQRKQLEIREKVCVLKQAKANGNGMPSSADLADDSDHNTAAGSPHARSAPPQRSTSAKFPCLSIQKGLSPLEKKTTHREPSCAEHDVTWETSPKQERVMTER